MTRGPGTDAEVLARIEDRLFEPPFEDEGPSASEAEFRRELEAEARRKGE